MSNWCASERGDGEIDTENILPVSDCARNGFRAMETMMFKSLLSDYFSIITRESDTHQLHFEVGRGRVDQPMGFPGWRHIIYTYIQYTNRYGEYPPPPPRAGDILYIPIYSTLADMVSTPPPPPGPET